MTLDADISGLLREIAPPDLRNGSGKKNYTEAVSHRLAERVAGRLRDLGLAGTKSPQGQRDKQFMGGYGSKGVDVYLSDERHGLLLTSGIKGILFDVPKNLKNRYRDAVMEALELHKRFPYAVCGHLLFLSRSECAKRNQAFGTVLGEAVALLGGIAGRRRPDEAAEFYEAIGVVLLEPGVSDSVDLAPEGLPEDLQAATYCERLAVTFHQRNPFYRT